MKLIIPMAGRGTRLRPHSLTVPKPLVPVAGKPIVQRLVEDLAKACGKVITEVAFIIGDFGHKVEQDLMQLAEAVGAKGSIYHQKEKLGTAHAIMCAKESIDGPVIVAFADTLFQADFSLDTDADGAIWVQRVPDPSAYGVIKLDDNGVVKEFIEKPKVFVSDLAIVGIYYFKDGDFLKQELQYLLDNDIKERGEFQLTNALENMKQKGVKFKTHPIQEWLDCGNKNAVVHANKRVLEIKEDAATIAKDVVLENATIIPPCHIGAGSIIKNSIIGPHVSIGKHSCVEQAVIVNSVIQNHSHVKKVVLENSMIGNHVEYAAQSTQLSLGDFSKFSQ
ncbi:MAG: NTP transferase domain-containing protein [Saprospiraceae bacterium]|nr:NTP transferase domain-containing protein [Saprospiraceae bacterium]